jgi:pyruvate dehydrogenase E2 component (dihydrolipoamide acetyltransferase)
MAEVTQVPVPDIGDFTDVPVIEVLVKPGDQIAVEDPLVTLESDKATMEVPSPVAGVVAELKVGVGTKVSQGTVLLTVEAGENGAAATTASDATAETEPAASREEPAAEEPSTQEPPDAGASEETAPPPAPAESVPSAPPAPALASPGDGPIYASPSIRRLARELRVSLATLAGSGRLGRIVASDVHAAASGGSAAATPGGAALQLAPWPDIDFAEFGPIEREPLSRIAKKAGPYLQRNWVTIPHVTQFDEADITDLEAFRVATNEGLAKDGVKLTMVSLLMKACVASLQEFPRFNASLDGEELVLKKYVHVGFAADTPFGLVVPVIRDVDRKGIVAIARELAELSATAREGKLSPAQMSGGSFTISSLGGIGGTAFTPIINAPEVAILGVSRSATKPVWNGSEFRPRLMLPLSLSYDHRVIDGAAAARFTTHLAGVLGDLKRALL